jgi:hypothetical protein
VLHAVITAPVAWEAQKVAGETYLHVGKPREALPHLKRWAELRPDQEPAALAVALAEKRIAGNFSAQTSEPVRPSAAGKGGQTLSSPTRPPSAPPLGEVARQHARPNTDQEAIAGTAPATLDYMRRRAEASLRPRMQGMSAPMKQLRAAFGKYRTSCQKPVSAGPRETVRYGSESAWTQSWTVAGGSPAGSGPECQILSTEINALLTKVSGALVGVDKELGQPPSVFPAIREEVYGRLVSELW